MRTLILCYHKVGSESEEGRFLNIDPSRFASHVRFFARKGVRFFSAKEMPNRPGVCLTFDDAYLSTLTNTLPILGQNNAVGTFYAVSDLVGSTSAWDGTRASKLADWDLLRKAQAEGHEIGNHTASHIRLSTASKETQVAQIEGCTETLTAQGLEVRSICYPYGSYNADTLDVVKSLGLVTGLSLRKGPLTPNDQPHELPRIAVAFSDALPLLIYKAFLRRYTPQGKPHA